MYSVDPYLFMEYLYCSGSLVNVAQKAGSEPTGFEFCFYCYLPRIYFFGCHKLILTVDGREIDERLIIVESDGESLPAKDLVESHFMVLEGQKVRVIVQDEKGLKPGSHSIEFGMISSGDFGGTSRRIIPLARSVDDVSRVHDY